MARYRIETSDGDELNYNKWTDVMSAVGSLLESNHVHLVIRIFTVNTIDGTNEELRQVITSQYTD
jgi:hypothetical protein